MSGPAHRVSVSQYSKKMTLCLLKRWKKKEDPSVVDRQHTRQQGDLKLTESVFSNSLEDEENQDESSEDADEPEVTSARTSRAKKNKGTNSCLKRHLSLAAQTIAYPDTQAQTSVTNKPEFVKEFRGGQITLLGIGGSGIPAQVGDPSFILKTKTRNHLSLKLWAYMHSKPLQLYFHTMV